MDAESQVGAHPAERRGSVKISAGKVEAVARLEQRLHQRSVLSVRFSTSALRSFQG